MAISTDMIFEILEASYDGIWITDGTGKILYANSANTALLGISKEYLENKTTQNLLDDKLFSDSVILEVLKTKKQASKISHNYRTNLVVLATATPIFDKMGEIKYILNNVRNITELNALQSKLRDKDEIIRMQKKELTDMKAKMGIGNIIAHSKSFLQSVELAQRVARFGDSTVLISGESGTGKELIADIVVSNSDRAQKPFIKINCGAIPENLLESELFGYEKGAFTGADSKGKKGLFELANGGTIFLDEIGDLHLHLQVKLLRVLQQKQIQRLGGSEPILLDVRVITATHRDLEKMIKDNLFREDLYYRLNVVTIHIAPLRERTEDIMPLVKYYLELYNKKYGTNKMVSANTLSYFEKYPWPGNVRELENLIENLVITTPENVIEKDYLPNKFFIEGRDNSVNISDIMPLKKAVRIVEKELIEKALEKYGSIRKAAKVLDINASTIVRKLQSYQPPK